MIFGRYQLLELLGTGGMAEVFKAKSYGVEGFEKLLVIKRILSLYSDNEEFVEMFVNEAKIAVSLNHANIVQIYDLGKAGDAYFMAMEYVQGMDLGAILEWRNTVHRQMPLEAVIHVICEVAKGLDYAHRKKDQDHTPLNIVHRDISPQNILISTEGEVKITDFGIARALNIVDSNADSPKGKFAYMAPEQAIAAPHDKRVDIFSLGMVFYELLTGTNPLRDHTPAEVLKIIQNPLFPDCQVPCCGTLDAIPVDLEPILRRALAPNPDDRYHSAADLYEALLTFAYMEGLRAGGSSLAEYIAPLVEEQQQSPLISSLHSISPRHSGLVSGHTNDATSTSVQRPSDAELAQFEDQNAIHLTAGVREVALLSYAYESRSFDSRILIKKVESFGAVLIEKEDTRLTFAFGIHVASDALHSACKSALSVAAAIGRDNAFKAAGKIGAGIHLTSLVVEYTGNVKLTVDYTNAVEQCVELAELGADTILFDSPLHPLIGRWFRCTPFSSGDNTGLYQLVAYRSEQPTLTKLIGRRQELRQMGDTLAAVSEGHGQILSLSGPAGVGKSRLLFEVKKRLHAAGHKFSWFETTCSPWQKKKSFAMLRSIMLNIIGSEKDGSEKEDDREKLTERLKALDAYNLPGHELAAMHKFITARNAENVHVLKSAFVRIIRHSARMSLTIVAIDHLTAVDDESLDVLHALSHSISDMPVLLVVAIRMGYIHGFEGSPVFSQCDVEPLTDSEMVHLIHACVPAPSERLVRDIMKVSANLPQFAEETIYALQNEGALKVTDVECIYMPKTMHCPMSIRNMVASELFALPRDRREILQLAGCLREKIEAEVLALLLNRTAPELLPILHMLSKVRILSVIDDTTFRFPSPFMQEAVYLSIEKSERLLIHRTVAQRIEQEYPTELEKYAEPLAVHYLKSDSKKAAFEYLIIAARNAAVTLDNETAVKYYLMALDLSMTGIGNVSRYDIFEQLAAMAVQTSQANVVLKKAIRLKAELDEESETAGIDEIDRLYALMLDAQEAILWAHVGEYEEAISQLRLVITSQEEGEAKLSQRYLAEILIDTGSIAEAMEILESITNDANTQLDPFAHAHLTVCLALSGNVDHALERIEQHRPSASVAPVSILYLTAEGHCLFMKKKYDLAIEAYATALTFATEQNMKREIAAIQYQLATCALAQKDYRKAFEYLRDAMEISTELQFQSLKDRAQIGLWFIDAEKFGSEDALAQLQTMDVNPLDVGTRILIEYCLSRVFISMRKSSDAKKSIARATALIEKHRNQYYRSHLEALAAGI
ncbi:MAG: protein kinase [Deltaproteobacteria bacterium]|nr:protein kinase [Deltaproteobacteria bacterium]